MTIAAKATTTTTTATTVTARENKEGWEEFGDGDELAEGYHDKW
jgi:hypothetical protein